MPPARLREGIPGHLSGRVSRHAIFFLFPCLPVSLYLTTSPDLHSQMAGAIILRIITGEVKSASLRTSELD